MLVQAIYLLTCRPTKRVSYVRQSSSDKFGLGLDISIQKQLKCVLQGFPFFSLKNYIVPLVFLVSQTGNRRFLLSRY